MGGPADQKRDYPGRARDAVEKLMAVHGSTVLRTAFYFLGDRHLAEDVCQEVFLRAFRAWGGFRGDCSVKTWLTGITVNLCRGKAARGAEQATDPEVMEHTDPHLEEEVWRRLDRTTVLKHVLALSTAYRNVVYLYYYLDLSTRDIALATGSPEGTIRARLHRARELLAQKLVEDGITR